RAAFPFDESARNLAAGGILLAVIYREGEKILIRSDVSRNDGGAEHHGVSLPDDYGAVGLFCEPAGLQRYLLAGCDLNFLANGFFHVRFCLRNQRYFVYLLSSTRPSAVNIPEIRNRLCADRCRGLCTIWISSPSRCVESSTPLCQSTTA